LNSYLVLIILIGWLTNPSQRWSANGMFLFNCFGCLLVCLKWLVKKMIIFIEVL